MPLGGWVQRAGAFPDGEHLVGVTRGRDTLSCCRRRAAEGMHSALCAVGCEVSPRGSWLLG